LPNLPPPLGARNIEASMLRWQRVVHRATLGTDVPVVLRRCSLPTPRHAVSGGLLGVPPRLISCRSIQLAVRAIVTNSAHALAALVVLHAPPTQTPFLSTATPVTKVCMDRRCARRRPDDCLCLAVPDRVCSLSALRPALFAATAVLRPLRLPRWCRHRVDCFTSRWRAGRGAFGRSEAQVAFDPA
jgi:hypothetical protein